MKFGRVFPICVLLLICLQFQVSDGVICSHVVVKGSRDQIFDILFKGIKLKQYMGLPGFEVVTGGNRTCPEACAQFWCGTTKETAILGNGCPEDFYHTCSTLLKEIATIQEKRSNDVEYYNENVFYVSGCGSEIDGTKCIDNKFINLHEKVKELTTTPKSVSNGQNDASNPSNDSNNKNDATKLIGIIIFGWIFALWNL